MEELPASRLGGGFSGGGVRTSRKAAAAAKSDYDDVFGGPPQYAVPFAAGLDDYYEIFGGLAGSCCIPVLDLPSAMDGLDDVPVHAWRSSCDYAEIFGRFDGGEIAVPYQELFAEPKKEEASCSNESREQRGTGSDLQLTEESEFLPKHLNGGNMACVEEDRFSSNSNNLGDGLKELNVSYSKTSRGNIEHAKSGRTHVAQLNAVPGFATAVNGWDPLQNNMSNNPPDMVNRVIAGLDQGKKVPPISSGDNTMSVGSDLKADQRLHATKFSAAQNDHAKVEHYSHSSSSHSTCTVDVSAADTLYLTVSDISLRTQPLQVPPPSRPPPKLFNKQGLSTVKAYANSKTDLDEVKLQKPIANHQTHYSVTSSKSHAHQESVKKSSAFFDVEVDTSSAAAASAAAMKEAVEIAQARLKNAKESMERKRDSLQSHKVAHYEDVKCKERKVDNAAQEVESFNQVQTQKTLVKEEKRINSIASEERHEVTSATKIALDYEEKVRQVVSAEEDQHSMQATNFKFSEALDYLEMSSGKWKTNKQFCELIIGEKNDKTVREASEQNIIKHTGETTMISENKENVNKGAGRACEARGIGKLGEDNGSDERVENTMKLKDGNISFREEEIKEVPDMIPEAWVHEEKINMLEENQDPGKEENENPGKVPEANVNEEVKQQYTDDKAPASGESEKTSEPLNDACKIEGAGNEERKLEATKETFEGEDNEKKLSSTSVTCLPSKQEDDLNVDRKTGVLDELEKEIKFPHGSCVREGGDKVEAVEAASLCEYSGKARSKVECCYAKNEHRSEDTWVPDEQEESEKINLTQEECLSVKNELSLKVASEADKLEGNLKEQKRAIGAMGHGEQEKKTGSAKEACWQNSNEMKTLDAQLELMQNDNQKEGYKAPLQLANEQTVFESDLGMRRSEGINVHMASDIMEEAKKLNGSQGFFQKAVDSVMEDVQQTSLLAKEGKMPSSSQDAMKSSGLTSDRTTEDVWQASLLAKKDELASSAQDATESCALASNKTANNLHRTEERENESRVERETDQAKKQERKLEEEKEREREREKDRLDVERAAREVHERAFAEAREKAERIAMERATAEARQRASEKTLRTARLRAERAAVERATAEARERAIEKALAEKAASEANERMERFNATSRERMRKDNLTEDHFKTRDKDIQDVARSAPFQSSSSSGTCQRYSDFNSQGEGEPNLRYKARLERHQRTVERAAKALAEKNMRDLHAQRELAERNRLAEYLDAEIKRWLTGKEGNLRALLSTLHYILGPESGWQPISLTDVITTPAVKKAYRKATLCVHPDKLQQRGASIQQKYICEKVFDLLKDAWHRFNSEER